MNTKHCGNCGRETDVLVYCDGCNNHCCLVCYDEHNDMSPVEICDDCGYTYNDTLPCECSPDGLWRKDWFKYPSGANGDGKMCIARGPHCFADATMLLWQPRDQCFYTACDYCGQYEQERLGSQSVRVLEG